MPSTCVLAGIISHTRTMSMPCWTWSTAIRELAPLVVAGSGEKECVCATRSHYRNGHQMMSTKWTCLYSEVGAGLARWLASVPLIKALICRPSTRQCPFVASLVMVMVARWELLDHNRIWCALLACLPNHRLTGSSSYRSQHIAHVAVPFTHSPSPLLIMAFCVLFISRRRQTCQFKC